MQSDEIKKKGNIIGYIIVGLICITITFIVCYFVFNKSEENKSIDEPNIKDNSNKEETNYNEYDKLIGYDNKMKKIYSGNKTTVANEVLYKDDKHEIKAVTQDDYLTLSINGNILKGVALDYDGVSKGEFEGAIALFDNKYYYVVLGGIDYWLHYLYDLNGNPINTFEGVTWVEYSNNTFTYLKSSIIMLDMPSKNLCISGYSGEHDPNDIYQENIKMTYKDEKFYYEVLERKTYNDQVLKDYGLTCSQIKELSEEEFDKLEAKN